MCSAHITSVKADIPSSIEFERLEAVRKAIVSVQDENLISSKAICLFYLAALHNDLH